MLGFVIKTQLVSFSQCTRKGSMVPVWLALTATVDLGESTQEQKRICVGGIDRTLSYLPTVETVNCSFQL